MEVSNPAGVQNESGHLPFGISDEMQASNQASEVIRDGRLQFIGFHFQPLQGQRAVFDLDPIEGLDLVAYLTSLNHTYPVPATESGATK